MKRRPALGLALLLAAACSAAPPARAPTHAPIAVAAPRRFFPAVEREDKQLVARDPEGKVIWSIEGERIAAFAPAADGGAFVQSAGKDPVLVRVDPDGKSGWLVPAVGGDELRIRSNASLVVVERKIGRDRVIRLHRSADGSLILEETTGEVAFDPEAGLALLGSSLERRGPRGERLWSLELHGFPDADPSAPQVLPRLVAISPSGVVLTGAEDGSLLGVDPGGHPRFQLGLRGAVKGIAVRPGGDFVVTTDRGIVAAVGPEGAVRWETAIGTRELSAPLALPGGEVAVSSDSGAVHLLSAEGAPRWHEPAAASSYGCRSRPACLNTRET